ncbi:hypothetical protein [Gelidibacter salicanalis]|uniref:hypothetical protein n=1 Tax=Gelidibacter salicanalis TaxID=291193 RepID=UPI001FE98A7C|nr:hypothetical protein [Gelidibacter salicanalis]
MQYIDSGVSVKKTQWDDRRKKVKKHPLVEKLNAGLDSLIISIQKIYYNNRGVSANGCYSYIRITKNTIQAHF